jgi:hypothetical protein
MKWSWDGNATKPLRIAKILAALMQEPAILDFGYFFVQKEDATSLDLPECK